MNELCVLQSFNSRSLFTSKSSTSFLYLLGADFLQHLYKKASFVVYHGHHYETSLSGLNFLLLPSTSFVERSGLFVNCNGRCQIAGQAVAPAGDAVSNERTIYSLYKYLLDDTDSVLEFTDFSSLLRRILPYRLNYVSSFDVCRYLQQQRVQHLYHIHGTVFVIQLRTFYDIDIISRSNTDFFELNGSYNTVHNYA